METDMMKSGGGNIRGDRGFTLVELLVVMLILAIALLGLMALQIANIRSISGNHKREMAVFLLKSFLDEVQASAMANRMRLYNIPVPANIANKPYLKAGQGTTTWNASGDVTSKSDVSGFQLDWEVVNAPNGVPDTLEVRANVVWFTPGVQGGFHQRNLSMNRLIQR